MSKKRKPHPSQNELQELFFYDPATGLLHWRVRPGYRVKLGDVAGSINKSIGYRYARIRTKNYFAHNLIWIWNYGDIPEGKEVDHADKDRLNNRLGNLRLATSRQQSINKKALGFSRQKGCSLNPWRATHTKNGAFNTIGFYRTALNARLAYERYTSELEPEFASTWLTDAVREFCSGGSPTVWMPG